MTTNGWLQIAFFSICFLLVAKPLGLYLVRVFDGSVRWLRPVENLFYRVSGVNPQEDQHWTRYAAGMLLFSAASMLFTYLALRLQHLLPLNPQGFAGGAGPPGVRDRGQLHDEHQLAELQRRVDDVVPLADDAARLPQLHLGSRRHRAGRGAGARHRAPRQRSTRPARQLLGRTWCAARCTCCCRSRSSLALFMVQQGVIQNFKPYLEVTTLEGAKQTLAMGPVASQEAIKQLGTNGGGFFNANAAHPFENPTPWSNFSSMFIDLHDPVGADVDARPHGEEPAPRLGGVGGDVRAVRRRSDHRVLGRGARQSDPRGARHRRRRPPTRIPAATWRARRSASASRTPRCTPWSRPTPSCGAVNSMHDSFTPLGGLVPLVNMQLGEVIFGGVGAGLYGMLVMVVLTVFIAGLMVGRTPEYLGKKIQAREVQMAMLYVLAAAASILVLHRDLERAPGGPGGPQQRRPARPVGDPVRVLSTTGNNGSAFAGLTGGTYWYNTQLGLATLIGRFAMIVPMLGARRLPGRKEGRRRDRPARSPCPVRSSSRCSSASSSSSARSPSSPRSRSARSSSTC